MKGFRGDLARLKKRRRSVRPQDLDRLLRATGFERRSGRAQDCVYFHPRLIAPFAVPIDDPVLPVYVSRAVRAIEAVIGS